MRDNTAISINVVGKSTPLDQKVMWVIINKFTKLSYGSPLQKINYIGKCVCYFHPSYRSVSRGITAESQKTYTYP